jgi:hypothetical protein
MATATLPERHPPNPPSACTGESPRPLRSSFFDVAAGPADWNFAAYAGLAALVALWAWRFHSTWATWGNLSIDSGREMYVPAALARGKMLYRDVWYLYGPAGSYVNSWLFRLFGIHLSVLYWAGSLSALGCAVLLYSVALRFSSWIVASTIAAIVLLEAFETGLFNYPAPYSFASVYGSLAACLFLWCAIHASDFPESAAWMFAAATAAAVALLCKVEFGAACYAVLGLLILTRWLHARSWSGLARNLLACVPGLAACALVAAWMVSIAGFEFITQENLPVSWPTSYFLRTYGKLWLQSTGMTIDGHAILLAALRTLLLAAIVVGFRQFLRRVKSDARQIFVLAALLAAVCAFLVGFLPPKAGELFLWIFFPQDMVLYVAVAALACWWRFYKQDAASRNASLPLLLTFASLLGARILLGMNFAGYPIYYNGAAILSFLLLAPSIVAGTARASRTQREALICVCCLTAVIIPTGLLAHSYPLVPLITERGTMRVSASAAANYQAAIEFIREKNAAGELVLSVPEDTALYFFSGQDCPTRAFAFTPGMVAPGKMTDAVIAELERKRVGYLLWADRQYPEYGAHGFGEDFDQDLAAYFRSHYRPLRPLASGQQQAWNAVIWERLPEKAGAGGTLDARR